MLESSDIISQLCIVQFTPSIDVTSIGCKKRKGHGRVLGFFYLALGSFVEDFARVSKLQNASVASFERMSGHIFRGDHK